MTWIARARRAFAEVIAWLLARWQRRRKAWAWFVARAASLRFAQPTREVRAPLAEELRAAAQRTRELLKRMARTQGSVT